MTTLDSRQLSYVNTFGRRFGEPGAVRYRLVSAAVACQPPGDDLPFTIENGDKGETRQHDVTVRQRGERLAADPAELQIGAGDVVLWHSLAGTNAYVVQGQGAGGEFDSSSLTGDTLYTHAFGVPGDYEWVDARGRSVKGLVRVGTLETSERDPCREWMRALENGTLVVIEGARSDPSEVSILAGQTVFFAVTAADGITITDSGFVTG